MLSACFVGQIAWKSRTVWTDIALKDCKGKIRLFAWALREAEAQRHPHQSGWNYSSPYPCMGPLDTGEYGHWWKQCPHFPRVMMQEDGPMDACLTPEKVMKSWLSRFLSVVYLFGVQTRKTQPWSHGVLYRSLMSCKKSSHPSKLFVSQPWCMTCSSTWTLSISIAFTHSAG